MVTKEIKSLQHPIVKHLVKLRKEKGYREEKNALLLEGKKLLFEYQGTLKVLMTTKKATIPSHLSSKVHYIVPMEVIEKISGMPAPEPFVAEVSLPLPGDLQGKKTLLALDRISDPGNLGTLIRTAVAFEFDGIFLIEGGDPFAPKALRAAKGATFHIPIRKGTEEDLSNLIEKNQLTPYVADISGKDPSFTSPLILILGNETHGPSQRFKKWGIKVAIPTGFHTDSLNVAVAGGILMNKIRET